MKTTSLLALLLAAPLLADEAEKKDDYAKEPEKKASPHVFGWPFVEWEKMQPRGGSTQGTEVTLAEAPRAGWKELRADGLSDVERDRRAILAMAGDYRVSFDFLETLGFSDDYTPPRPYFSWGTEHVEVLESSEKFIQLQHTLVMYFKNEEGEEVGPMVMKHWRQDWTYEPAEIWTYRGDLTWKKIPAPDPKGRWSQAVWQVDDSPRYEVVGKWSHEGGLSTWRSDNCPRPLPRREFSVRSDYNILEGVHEITIAPNGWLHTQNNRKLSRENGSEHYVGLEVGIDRYEAITAPDLATPFADSWKKTAPYWEQVRTAWSDALDDRKTLKLKPKVEDQKLWQVHFAKAGELEAEDSPDHSGDAEHARETLERFIVK
ncbi:DUF6607 family protein [Haloferula helveola]